MSEARSQVPKDHVTIYSDGGGAPNPGPGGWAAILLSKGHRKELKGGELRSTNNRMELMAAISGLEALTRPMQVRVYTDSMYVRDGISSWLPAWKARGWKTADKKPVKNVDLWQRLDAAAACARATSTPGQISPGRPVGAMPNGCA